MMVPFTKFASPILSLIVLSGGLFALFVMGYRWAINIAVMSLCTAAWLGFQASLFHLTQHMADDRGRRSFYVYLDLEASKDADRWKWIYGVSTAIAVGTTIACLTGTVGTCVFDQSPRWTQTSSSTGVPLNRAESAMLAAFGSLLAALGSICLSYVHKGRGTVFVYTCLANASAFVLLALYLLTFEG